MASYLLTGAAGFIGARLADFLLREGHQVYGLDNLSPAYDLRMKRYRLKVCWKTPTSTFCRTTSPIKRFWSAWMRLFRLWKR